MLPESSQRQGIIHTPKPGKAHAKVSGGDLRGNGPAMPRYAKDPNLKVSFLMNQCGSPVILRSQWIAAPPAMGSFKDDAVTLGFLVRPNANV